MNTHPNESQVLKVGQPAPEFSLLDADGTLYSLKKGLSSNTVVIVFYRGDW